MVAIGTSCSTWWLCSLAQNTSHMTYDDNCGLNYRSLISGWTLLHVGLSFCVVLLTTSIIRIDDPESFSCGALQKWNEIIKETETNWCLLSYVASDKCRLLHRRLMLFLLIKLFLWISQPFRVGAAASLHKKKENRLRSCFNEIAVRSKAFLWNFYNIVEATRKHF